MLSFLFLSLTINYKRNLGFCYWIFGFKKPDIIIKEAIGVEGIKLENINTISTGYAHGKVMVFVAGWEK